MMTTIISPSNDFIQLPVDITTLYSFVLYEFMSMMMMMMIALSFSL